MRIEDVTDIQNQGLSLLIVSSGTMRIMMHAYEMSCCSAAFTCFGEQQCTCAAVILKGDLAIQIFHDEGDDDLQDAEVENMLALQGADEGDAESDGTDDLDRSDSDAASDESDADDE